MNQTAVQKLNKPSALTVMASRLSVEPEKMLTTLKSTVFKSATTEELMALVVVSNEYQLNPFLKEIYAFPAKGGGIVPVVSVDGWNKMLIRQDSFDGVEFEMVNDEGGDPYSCTCTVSVKNRSKPVKITEYFEECFRDTEPWRKMPRRMLRHRALCQASRVAFGFAGVYSEDEAKDFIDVSPLPKAPPAKLVAVTSEPSGGEQPPAERETKPPMPPEDINALEALVTENGFTFNHFQTWAKESGNIQDADSLSGWDDVKASDAKRLLRAKTGLLKGLETAKAQEGATA